MATLIAEKDMDFVDVLLVIRPDLRLNPEGGVPCSDITSSTWLVRLSPKWLVRHAI
jgi:hypothetical protein